MNPTAAISGFHPPVKWQFSLKPPQQTEPAVLFERLVHDRHKSFNMNEFLFKWKTAP
jgi:hypothetical protein